MSCKFPDGCRRVQFFLTAFLTGHMEQKTKTEKEKKEKHDILTALYKFHLLYIEHCTSVVLSLKEEMKMSEY